MKPARQSPCGPAPKYGVTMTKRTIMLDAGTIERAKLLGGGNLSAGLREAVKRVRLPFEQDVNPAPTDAGAGSLATVPEVSGQ